MEIDPINVFAPLRNALIQWIETNGYQIITPNREIYLKGPGPNYEPAEYVTELQFPVQKA